MSSEKTRAQVIVEQLNNLSSVAYRLDTLLNCVRGQKPMTATLSGSVEPQDDFNLNYLLDNGSNIISDKTEMIGNRLDELESILTA